LRFSSQITRGKVASSQFTRNMRKINAALVHKLGDAPKYGPFELAQPEEGQVQVKVLASGLHQLVRSRASGKHYSSTTALPLIPGVDGVGRLTDGNLVYFMAFAAKTGSFAEYVNVDKKDCLPLPPNTNPNIVAALTNPVMSSWMALAARAHVKKGFSVLILGVTGVAGQLAIQVSRALGAARIVGLGRNQATLNNLLKSGLDASITLADDESTSATIAKEAANVDVVLDYLWGSPAKLTLETIAAKRADSAHQLEWVQIGNLAGATMELAAGILRSRNIYLSGSGIGSLTTEDMHKHIADLLVELTSGHLKLDVVENVPLKDIEKIWNQKTERRVVFNPSEINE